MFNKDLIIVTGHDGKDYARVMAICPCYLGYTQLK
jgi:hypothetical protein